VVAVDGLAFPPLTWILAALGVGLISGLGSICYCLSLDSMPVSLVVTLAGMLVLVHPPLKYGVHPPRGHRCRRNDRARFGLLLSGLGGLPVSVASALSDTWMAVTVILSTIVLRQPLTTTRGASNGAYAWRC
jgi:drug/metabolite transporter (DMT)-like permease